MGDGLEHLAEQGVLVVFIGIYSFLVRMCMRIYIRWKPVALSVRCHEKLRLCKSFFIGNHNHIWCTARSVFVDKEQLTAMKVVAFEQGRQVFRICINVNTAFVHIAKIINNF